jgi:hypothetical protein
MVTKAVAETAKNAGAQVGQAADAALDAAAQRHPSARTGPGSSMPAEPSGAGAGSGDLPASEPIADLEER